MINYRPISILPSFSKVLEKLVYNRLYKFLNDRDIFYKHQYGFRAKHSTVHPITQLIKHVTTQNDKGTKDITLAIFLDLRKAFDTVSHDILLDKLKVYGIRGIANNWFKSYLSNRTQYVEYAGVKSSLKSLDHGVPQGSILGPLLFLLYINDLPNATSLNILSFADDTTAYISDHNMQNLQTNINRELNKIYIWLCHNKLSLNIEKTSYMVFSAKRLSNVDNEIQLKVNDCRLQRNGHNMTNETNKFLGIHFDETLTWKFHIDKVSRTISKALFALNKVKNFLPKSSLRTLYFSLIHCHISYGLLAWGNSCAINRLYLLQKRAVRIISGKAYRAHTDPLFLNLEILKIYDEHKMQSLLFAHDYWHDKLPSSFKNFYDTGHNVATRRHNQKKLYTHRPRTNFSRDAAYYKTAILWNNLNENLKIDNRSKFKWQMRKYYLSQYPATVQCGNRSCLECAP